jgi:hypothetical protein
MPVKPTTSVVNQKIDDHVGACADRYQSIEHRLYRIEAIMIGASVSIIGLLIKIIMS